VPRETQRILGIDTALRVTGLGAVEASGGACTAIEYGVVVNPPKRPVADCLVHLRREIAAAITRVKPSVVAIEGVFYCRNVRTAIALGAARGAALIACAEAELPVFEYSPREVKQSITGRGGAEKEQVGRMVAAMLGLPAPAPEDAADALALAICHAHRATSRALGLERRLSGPANEQERVS
jgi:crossover junction endodeoxyribonuclease RuvC